MTDWKALAEREAAVIIAEAMPSTAEPYATLVSLVAIGWLQGANYGTHATLHEAEAAFDSLRAAL